MDVLNQAGKAKHRFRCSRARNCGGMSFVQYTCESSSSSSSHLFNTLANAVVHIGCLLLHHAPADNLMSKPFVSGPVHAPTQALGARHIVQPVFLSTRNQAPTGILWSVPACSYANQSPRDQPSSMRRKQRQQAMIQNKAKQRAGTAAVQQGVTNAAA